MGDYVESSIKPQERSHSFGKCSSQPAETTSGERLASASVKNKTKSLIKKKSFLPVESTKPFQKDYAEIENNYNNIGETAKLPDDTPPQRATDIPAVSISSPLPATDGQLKTARREPRPRGQNPSGAHATASHRIIDNGGHPAISERLQTGARAAADQLGRTSALPFPSEDELGLETRHGDKGSLRPSETLETASIFLMESMTWPETASHRYSGLGTVSGPGLIEKGTAATLCPPAWTTGNASESSVAT